MPGKRVNKRPVRPGYVPPGWFRVDRAIFNSPYLKNETFTEREALVWLLAEQAFAHRIVDGPCGPITLDVGELSFADEFLGLAWGWTEIRAHRFIRRLVDAGVIERRIENGQQVITICGEMKNIGSDKMIVGGTENATHPDRKLTVDNYNHLNLDNNFHTEQGRVYPSGEWVDRLLRNLPRPAFIAFFGDVVLEGDTLWVPTWFQFTKIQELFLHKVQRAIGHQVKLVCGRHGQEFDF